MPYELDWTQCFSLCQENQCMSTCGGMYVKDSV